jgi:hypothetical protein
MPSTPHTLHAVRRALASLGGVMRDGAGDRLLDLARDGGGTPRRATVRATRAPRPVHVSSAGVPVFEGFLDGLVRHAVVAHVRGAPVIVGTVAAAIRARRDGRMTTWGTPCIEQVVCAPGSWFDAAVAAQLRASLADVDVTLHELDEDTAGDAPRHPASIAGAALQHLARLRDARERDCARAWCAEHPDRPLYLDGTLGRGPHRLDARGAIGVVKSHGTLYVADDAGADAVFALGEGERTPVSHVLDGGVAAGVVTWYLRLRDASGRDPFFGLVRVECATRDRDDATLEAHADAVSGWLLAERTPVARPDANWDVLPYAARDVGRWLRAVA